MFLTLRPAAVPAASSWPSIRKLCWIVWSSSDVFSPGETVSIPSRPKHPNRTPLSQPRSPQSSMTQLSQQQNSVATGPPNPSPPKLSWGPPPRLWSERIFPRTGSNHQPPTSWPRTLLANQTTCCINHSRQTTNQPYPHFFPLKCAQPLPSLISTQPFLPLTHQLHPDASLTRQLHPSP